MSKEHQKVKFNLFLKIRIIKLVLFRKSYYKLVKKLNV